MQYSEFKDYLVTHLWKMGDQVVLNSLDLIIKTAEDELERDFKMEDRVTVTSLTATSNQMQVPTDYRELRSLYPSVGKSLDYVPPSVYASLRDSNSLDRSQFTIANRTIYLVDGGTVNASKDFELWYYKKVPRFADLGAGEVSWMAEEYFDVYLYTCLKHTAPFLREDERLATWAALGGDAMNSAQEENIERKYAGSPIKIKFK